MEEVDILLHSFLTSVLDGGEYGAVFLHLVRYKYRAVAAGGYGIHVEWWVDFRAGLDMEEKVLLLFWKLGHDFLAIPPVDEPLYRLSKTYSM